MKNINVFVYGTLKKGFSNHSFIEKSKFIDNVFTVDIYAMFIDNFGPYPYLLDINYGHNINGELYSVLPEDLIQLDWLEGCPDFYFRKEIIVSNGTEKFKAFCYFLSKNNEPFDQIPLSEFILT